MRTMTSKQPLTEHSTSNESIDNLNVNNEFSHNLDLAFSSIKYQFDFKEIGINKFWENYYGIVNLSDTKLSRSDIGFLSRGLKFCPTPPVYDHGRLKESIDRFFRTISLHLFFSDIKSDDKSEQNINPQAFQHKELKLASTFNPPMPSNLEYMYNMVINQMLVHKLDRKRTRNMSNLEYQAMYKMVSDCNVIV